MTQRALCVPEAMKEARIFASPLARKEAKIHNIELAQLTGSGPHGRIIKKDISAFLDASPEAPPSNGTSNGTGLPSMREELTPMRRIIAERLTHAKQTIPHFYLSVECRIDGLIQMRRQINEFSGPDLRVSLNDLFIKIAAKSIDAVPEVNASWDENAIRYYERADIAVAVAVLGGLYTPVVRDAGQKNIETIAREMKDFIERAKKAKLAPEEYQNGSFSLSNLGMFGAQQFSAIINPPQACILAIGAGEKKPLIINDQITIATAMTATLSADHRVVDGAVAAQFLSAFKRIAENPGILAL